MRAQPLVAAVLVMAILFGAASAQEFEVRGRDVKGDEADYSPYVDLNIPNRVYFGDTHHHTSYSPDAGLVGNTLGPDEAYRFARGEVVTTSSGLRARLIRPLDFLVVSDHAEYIGLADMLRDGDPVLTSDPTGKRWYDMYRQGGDTAYKAFVEIVASATRREKMIDNKAVERSIWQRFTGIADQFNSPGVFSAFIGFEWSSVPSGNNLHRVMVFREGKAWADQVLPYSLFDSEDPEDLWKYLTDYEARTGGRVLAIPHNGNLSNGIMFAETRFNGEPIDIAYAEQRRRWEPIVEVTQIKGDGETHPLLSPEDEFADYETWDKGNLNLSDRLKEDWMLQYEYARSALRLGLKLGAQVGVNPYKFGMIGSTDTHTSIAATREENYFGKFAGTEPNPERYTHKFMTSPLDPGVSVYSFQEVASGLAAVWARENTREALWDAMARKEVYATTGTRMQVRVFAGWDFEADEVARPDFAVQGYARGVPMGGDLSAAPAGAAPRFMIRAMRDVDGANLDRLQIVKGWLDADGQTRERIFDVAVSDGREIDADGRCRVPVGSTVDVANATYTNTIGDAVMMAYWQDPTFDPDQDAFYYVRVIEIPTPRWTAYDAQRFGITMPPEVEMTTQDRAYTSPIWYTAAR